MNHNKITTGLLTFVKMNNGRGQERGAFFPKCT